MRPNEIGGIQWGTMSLPKRSTLAAAAELVASEPVAPTPAFVDTWRQLHYAAQLASEVGKAWAVAQPDDSHSSFTWSHGELLGAPVAAPSRLRATLRVRDLELRLVAEDGTALASRSLGGVTLAEGMRWIRAEAARLAGPPRQLAAPAPDLPHHLVADGAPFTARAQDLAALARLLGGADALLRAVTDAQGAKSPVSIWPHHFDMAVLLEPAPQRTIGVGLAVPDALEASGYWYVSPWSAQPPEPDATHWPPLAHGRWIARGDAPRMAALPLGAWSALGDASLRRDALVDFLTTAISASEANLAR